jgi:hypothetical protein
MEWSLLILGMALFGSVHFELNRQRRHINIRKFSNPTVRTRKPKGGVMQRRRFKNILTFPERLDQEVKRLRTEAEKLPHGPERDQLLRKARHAETALHVNDWLSSAELKPPE